MSNGMLLLMFATPEVTLYVMQLTEFSHHAGGKILDSQRFLQSHHGGLQRYIIDPVPKAETVA